MPLGGLGIATAAGIGSGIVGGLSSAADKAKAAEAREAAVKQWLAIHVPDPAQQAIELQKYKVAGQLSPKLETAFQQSQTGLKDLSIDPTSRAAEVDALSRMQDIAHGGGMDAQARQAEAQALNASNANERGQRGAIQQSFAARGMGGSGAQLAAELQASQGDANQAAASGLQSAASGEQRALEALTRIGSAGSNLNSQDYSQAAEAAKAQDAINRFNTQTQQTVSNNNVGAENDAQKWNLNNAQDVSNRNTGVANTQETHNKGLVQQQFDNQKAIASGVSNAENGVADQANKSAADTQQLWGNIGSAIGQGAVGASQYAKNAKATPKPRLEDAPDGEVDLDDYQ